MFKKVKTNLQAKEDRKALEKRLIALGMDKAPAALFAGKIALACKRSGCTPALKTTVENVVCQAMGRQILTREDVMTLIEVCPYLGSKLLQHTKWQHRALLKHAESGRFTTAKFIECVMKGVR